MSAFFLTGSDICMVTAGFCYYPAAILFSHILMYYFILLFSTIPFISCDYENGYLKHHIYHRSIKIYNTKQNCPAKFFIGRSYQDLQPTSPYHYSTKWLYIYAYDAHKFLQTVSVIIAHQWKKTGGPDSKTASANYPFSLVVGSSL